MIETRFETGVIFPGEFNETTAETMPTVSLLYVLEKYITEPIRIINDVIIDSEKTMKRTSPENTKLVAHKIRDTITYITTLSNEELVEYWLSSKYYNDVVDELSFRGVNWKVYQQNVTKVVR